MTGFVTHDVKRLVVSRPEELDYRPGQGVEVAIDRPGWREEGRPFTPTSLTDDRALEFTIKAYPEHEGVTRELHALSAGDELLLSDPFGTITYQGPGAFIAGGAGVTPFLAILRRLARAGETAGHSLLFSNKTPADVLCEKELRHHLGERCLLTCTRESAPGYLEGRIDREFLEEHLDGFDQRLYVCGPPAFVDDVKGALTELGASPDSLVFED